MHPDRCEARTSHPLMQNLISSSSLNKFLVQHLWLIGMLFQDQQSNLRDKFTVYGKFKPTTMVRCLHKCYSRNIILVFKHPCIVQKHTEYDQNRDFVCKALIPSGNSITSMKITYHVATTTTIHIQTVVFDLVLFSSVPAFKV